MAKNKSTVYLGYEDDEISLKHAQHLNSNVNKIGGTPDWPSSDIKVPACPLCGTARPLIVQLYAPLEHSQFHRSIYVFACLNPACSQNSKGWLCIRTQHLDTQSQAEFLNAVTAPTMVTTAKQQKLNKPHGKQTAQKIIWCSGVDDWGDAELAMVRAGNDTCLEEMDTGADDEILQNEENGNVVSKRDNSPQELASGGIDEHFSVSNEPEPDVLMDEDDDDDESTSMENDMICHFGQLDMHSPQLAAGEDPNANCASGIAADGVGAAVVGHGGHNDATTTYAEIEGAETDVVFVETPKKPERDLIALLKHTSTPAALGPLAKTSDVTLKAFYMAVDIEQRNGGSVRDDYENYGGALSEDHISELYQEYKRQGEAHSLSPSACLSGVSVNASKVEGEKEGYEKDLPAHGDLLFHNFITTIQQNPGQILRYSRDTLPLLISPLEESVPKCQNCNGDTICEVQILSTLIPRLRLQQNSEPAPIEYGNVLVFTCLKSCWDTPDKMRYERVLVQTEL